jgi:type I restriction enzyme S subunit
MSEKNKKPEIRFKGFSDDWEERKLDELANFLKGHGYSKNDLIEVGTPIILYGRLYTKYEAIISDADTFVLDYKGSIYSTGNEVIVPASGETAEDIARASAVINSGILLGGDLNIIYPNSKINSIFLALTISNGKPQKDLTKRAQGKSVVHLRNADLKEVTILYPCTDEQSKIGTFFKHIDYLITLNQRKHNKLATIKKSMLEKMFPKNGADVPEIRFKGYTEAWEVKELGEMATIKTGFPIDSNKFNDNGEYLVITNGNIQNDSHTVDNSNGNRIDIENNASLSEYVLNPNDILVTMDGTVGRTAKVVEQKQILAQRVGRLTAKLETEFLYQFLNTGKFFKEMSLISHGGTIKHISLSEISSFISYMPSYREEQKKIGTFFKHLDTLITLQKQELEKLKNIKKACLEKMFV